MTTIGESVKGSQDFEVLWALGIDPDLPAEWATVDRCLTWLRERGLWMEANTAGLLVHVLVCANGVNGRIAAKAAPTLHAALIAACKAVQEAS